MRKILFRAKTYDGKWVEGLLTFSNEKYYISNEIDPFAYHVMPETIGEFTGLLDKNKIKIFEGDFIEFKRPIRTAQTHVGDNIPNGSYTEPMEPGIEIFEKEVIYKNGCFCFYNDYDQAFPLSWDEIYYDDESIKNAIEIIRPNGDLFSIWNNDNKGEDQGDLQYLLQEYNYANIEEMIKDISGFKVVGNIHDDGN